MCLNTNDQIVFAHVVVHVFAFFLNKQITIKYGRYTPYYISENKKNNYMESPKHINNIVFFILFKTKKIPVAYYYLLTLILQNGIEYQENGKNV